MTNTEKPKLDLNALEASRDPSHVNDTNVVDIPEPTPEPKSNDVAELVNKTQVIQFGKGDKGVSYGTYGDNYAVFIESLIGVGKVGEYTLPEHIQNKNDIILIFPTLEQAQNVADSLCGSKESALTSQKGIEELEKENTSLEADMLAHVAENQELEAENQKLRNYAKEMANFLSKLRRVNLTDTNDRATANFIAYDDEHAQSIKLDFVKLRFTSYQPTISTMELTRDGKVFHIANRVLRGEQLDECPTFIVSEDGKATLPIKED